MAAIPEKYLDLLQQKKAFANLATTMPDGSPQVTPVWFDYQDGRIRVNTAKGRVKARNMKTGVAVALALLIQIFYVIGHLTFSKQTFPPLAGSTIDDVHNIGLVLFGNYNLPFQIIGVLVLVATIGAVLLSKREPR